MSDNFETFGKYRLIEKLASGGMAEVYLAAIHGEAGFIKPVVIKRLHSDLITDNEFVQMLIDEARITAQLNHGNICQVLDLGTVNDTYYIAMEFVSGEDVRTLQDNCNLKGIEFPIEAAAHIISEVLAGLDYAHRKEGLDGSPLCIIHRDTSPQNILVSYEGEVKIIDFGIAKARMRLVQTQAGVIKGKFRYMSPEQALGKQVDHRTDIFACGVVLYELLRGEPHSINLPDTEVLRRMQHAEFEPLKKSRPNVPPALDSIVGKAIQRWPQDRFSSAAEFRNALLGFLQSTGHSYGRSDLAVFMQRVFESERRKQRSGSFSGKMIPKKESAKQPGPLERVPTERMDQEEAQESIGRYQDFSAVAFDKTTESRPRVQRQKANAAAVAAAEALTAAASSADASAHLSATESKTLHEGHAAILSSLAMQKSSRRRAMRIGIVAVIAIGLAIALSFLYRPIRNLIISGGMPKDQAMLIDAGARQNTGDPSNIGTARLGQIIVRSKPPNARVIFCGKQMQNTTPVMLKSPVNMECTLKIELKDYETYSMLVSAQEDKPTYIVATLRRIRSEAASNISNGTLFVTSDQVGTVYVNDKAMGRTPQLTLSLPAETYSVRVYFPSLDIQTKAQKAIVRAGQTTNIHFTPTL